MNAKFKKKLTGQLPCFFLCIVSLLPKISGRAFVFILYILHEPETKPGHSVEAGKRTGKGGAKGTEHGAPEEDADGVAMSWVPSKYKSRLTLARNKAKVPLIPIEGKKIPMYNKNGDHLYGVFIPKNRFGDEMDGYFYWNKSTQKMEQIVIDEKQEEMDV